MTRNNYSKIFGSPDGSHRSIVEQDSKPTPACKGEQRHVWGAWRQPPAAKSARKRHCKVCGKVQWRGFDR